MVLKAISSYLSLPGSIELFDESLKVWGKTSQTGKVCEEASELSAAVAKFIHVSSSTDNFDHILEECADVLIVMNQLFRNHDVAPAQMLGIMSGKLKKMASAVDKAKEASK